MNNLPLKYATCSRPHIRLFVFQVKGGGGGGGGWGGDGKPPKITDMEQISKNKIVHGTNFFMQCPFTISKHPFTRKELPCHH